MFFNEKEIQKLNKDIKQGAKKPLFYCHNLIKRIQNEKN